MNCFEINKVNNALLFIEGLYRITYALTAEKRQELYEAGFLNNPDASGRPVADPENHLLTEKALPQMYKQGKMVVEFNRYLQPELVAMLKTHNVSYQLLNNRDTGNIAVCFDKSELNKMKQIEKALYENCKYFPATQSVLNQINKTVDGAKTLTLSDLSDFQYRVLSEKLPQYKVTFVGNIVKDGMHTIQYSSVDQKKVEQCLKDTAEYLTTMDGIDFMKKVHTDEKVFKDIEDRVKNGETVYVASKQFGKTLKIEQNSFTVLEEKGDGRIVPAAHKNNPLPGNIFKNSSWLTMSQHIIEMDKPVLLNENEIQQFWSMSLSEREQEVNEKFAEMENSFTYDEDMTPEEVLQDFEKGFEFFEDRDDTLNVDELE